MQGRSRTPFRAAPACLGAFVVVLTTVAGCSTGSDGPNGPTGTTASAATSTGTLAPASSAPASPSPSVTPPVLPDAARQPTRPGAEAFFRYFIETYNYAYLAQDTSLIRGISESDCKFCNSAVSGVDAAVSARKHMVGGVGTVTVVLAAPGDPATGILVSAVVHQDASHLVDQDGKVVETVPEDPAVQMDAAVRFVQGAWQMRAVHVFPKGQK